MHGEVKRREYEVRGGKELSVNGFHQRVTRQEDRFLTGIPPNIRMPGSFQFLRRKILPSPAWEVDAWEPEFWEQTVGGCVTHHPCKDFTWFPFFQPSSSLQLHISLRQELIWCNIPVVINPQGSALVEEKYSPALQEGTTQNPNSPSQF